ncbi:uncharacterized protein P174DRAFT_464019 [Aspergillus novofumigatus IBT 16806]|uniref:Uncharacterized protein n=1 Tax=Aspergillus novofumigatus (strain IBT 16806) TaxID=1392255 RepID=A0A2I1BW28_ASPN1|nr:uncharacterized protein P174DRAFT_464019 [Aspergillus novofumigatus IBT 16806]PKX89587.1 hypothetical protein P174DRAFT_464019 [Aspergillus novofumigatus IBT 16806]
MATRLQHHGEVRARRWRPAIGPSRIRMNRHLLARRATLCPEGEREQVSKESHHKSDLRKPKENSLAGQRRRNIGNGKVLVGLPE